MSVKKLHLQEKGKLKLRILSFLANRLIQIHMYSFRCLLKLQIHNSNFLLDFSNQCSILFKTKQYSQSKFTIFQCILLAIAVCQKMLYCRYAKCEWVCVYRKRKRESGFSQQGPTTGSNFENKIEVVQILRLLRSKMLKYW